MAVKTISQSPLESLGKLLPRIMVGVSLIAFFYAILLFGTTGGFTNQVTMLKDDFLEGINGGFTSGNSSILTSGNVAKILQCFFVAEVAVLLILYMKNASNWKRILFGICILIEAILAGGLIFISRVNCYKIQVSEALENKIVELLINFDRGNLSAISTSVKVFVGIGIMALFVSVLLILISEFRWIIKDTTIALLLSYVILPLLLRVLENVIPLCAGIVWAVLVFVVVFAIFASFFGGGEGASSGSSGWSGSGVSSIGASSQSEGKKKTDAPEKKDNCIYISDYNRSFGIKLYKVHGATHDYVQLDNGIATREICSLESLKRGKYHIFDEKTKREIRENEIPWKS